MKYLELVKGQFTAEHEARAKQEEPYVAYSEEAGGVMFTFIPEPVVGPADNEIWYTSSDGNVVTPYSETAFGANIVSNTYEDGKGVIKFDNSLTSIGVYAFYGCSLTSITIPNSVTSIGDYAFCGSSLTSITIGNSVTSIGDCAFRACSSLTSVTIHNSVTTVGGGIFYKCSELESVVLSNNITSLPSKDEGKGAAAGFFGRCTSLSSITFEGTMEEWNNITKGTDWNEDVPATYVQCTDGQVEL